MRVALQRDLTAVVMARLVVSAIVVALGFRAISDDDYARTVIAQEFARSPVWDPSGTSWLPLPFWIHGGAMWLFGPSLIVAQATALLLGIAAVMGLYVAGHQLSGSRRAALAGTVLCCLVPYFALLGVATVPEAFSAALIVLGAASAGASDLRSRYVGSAALGAACLSRYEAWPVALGFCAVSAWDALRGRRLGMLGPALLAILPSLIWMFHGILHHHDATFFLTRVAAYKRALGGPGTSSLEALFAYPALAVRHEPEIMALGALSAVLGFRQIVRGRERSWLLLLALLAFLCAGQLYDGAPTHHAERALLPLWLWAALVAGAVFSRELEARDRKRRTWTVATAAGLLVAAALLRFTAGPPDPFVDRDAELAIGAQAGALIPGGARLAVDTTDYGFFAVIAAFARPGQSVVLDPRDPRKTPAADAFASPAALAERLEALSARWLVATSAHAGVAAELGRVQARNARFVLVEVGR